MKKICLVVLNYNDADTTINLVENVKNYKAIDNILIVDNNSIDDSFQRMKNYFTDEKIFIIKTDFNAGYAGGNNYGCKYAIEKLKADVLILANPDIFFEENIIKKLVNLLETDNVGIVSCKMNCLGTIKNVSSAWKLPTYKNCLLENLFLIKKIFGDPIRYKNEDELEGIMEVDVIAGSFFLIRSETFIDIEGFDSDTFLYYEENILGIKLKNKNYINYIDWDIAYAHQHSVSIDKSINSKKKQLKICQESRSVFLKKYLKVGKVKMFIERIVFFIGLNDYLIAKKAQLLYRSIFYTKDIRK